MSLYATFFELHKVNNWQARTNDLRKVDDAQLIDIGLDPAKSRNRMPTLLEMDPHVIAIRLLLNRLE